MPKNTVSPLENLSLSYPCPTTWESMVGDDRVRYCSKCQLNVYNLSGMTKPQAEKLISSAEGRICVAFYRRADGTVLTQNCPVGLAAVKQRVANTISLALSLLVTFFTAIGFYSFFPKNEPIINNEPSKSTLPVLDQKTLSEINAITNKANKETTPTDSNSSPNPNSKKVSPRGLYVGGVSINYIEPKVDPFHEESAVTDGKTLGILIRKDATCTKKEELKKD